MIRCPATGKMIPTPVKQGPLCDIGGCQNEAMHAIAAAGVTLAVCTACHSRAITTIARVGKLEGKTDEGN